jgi:acylphosphatase
MAVDRIRRRVVVHGRVQGVFFRSSTQDEARRAGIDGWVRNRPDGAVEAVFEGEADAVEQLVAYCHRGPPWAEVMRVDVIEEAPEGERGFHVSR